MSEWYWILDILSVHHKKLKKSAKTSIWWTEWTFYPELCIKGVPLQSIMNNVNVSAKGITHAQHAQFCHPRKQKWISKSPFIFITSPATHVSKSRGWVKKDVIKEIRYPGWKGDWQARRNVYGAPDKKATNTASAALFVSPIHLDYDTTTFLLVEWESVGIDGNKSPCRKFWFVRKYFWNLTMKYFWTLNESLQNDLSTFCTFTTMHQN